MFLKRKIWISIFLALCSAYEIYHAIEEKNYILYIGIPYNSIKSTNSTTCFFYLAKFFAIWMYSYYNITNVEYNTLHRMTGNKTRESRYSIFIACKNSPGEEIDPKEIYRILEEDGFKVQKIMTETNTLTLIKENKYEVKT